MQALDGVKPTDEDSVTDTEYLDVRLSKGKVRQSDLTAKDEAADELDGIEWNNKPELPVLEEAAVKVEENEDGKEPASWRSSQANSSAALFSEAVYHNAAENGVERALKTTNNMQEADSMHEHVNEPGVEPSSVDIPHKDDVSAPGQTEIDNPLHAMYGASIAPPPLDPQVNQPSRSSSNASDISTESSSLPHTPPTTVIYGVILVGFNHTLGPIVEYSYPPELQEDEDIVKFLPFLALPDGAHQVRF